MTEQEQGNGGTPQAPGETPTAQDFDTWLGSQDEMVRGLINSHTSGLKSALESERQQRKDFAKQLRDATAKVEQGSAAQTALQEITTRAEQAERRAAFFEESARADIGCANPRAAFLVASAENLFTKTGDPDWKRIKDAAPELFQRRSPQANAGSGTGAPPPKASGMNEYIRRAAGRG